MRGQITIEYMLLFLVSLFLLSLSAASLILIKDLADKNYQNFRFRYSVLLLSSTINELCAMGDGNSASLFFEFPLSLKSQEIDDGYAISFYSGNLSMVKKSHCNIESGNIKGELNVKNEKGIILFKEQ